MFHALQNFFLPSPNAYLAYNSAEVAYTIQLRFHNRLDCNANRLDCKTGKIIRGIYM